VSCCSFRSEELLTHVEQLLPECVVLVLVSDQQCLELVHPLLSALFLSLVLMLAKSNVGEEQGREGGNQGADGYVNQDNSPLYGFPMVGFQDGKQNDRGRVC
jgi:hypothetical protein